MGATPIYGLPYQGLGDSPHGPNLGQALAEAVEAQLVTINGLITALGSRVIPVAHLRQTVAQTGIATAVYTPITFNFEDLDPLGGHDNGTNPTRWTMPTGWNGAVMLAGGGKFATNTTGSRSARWAKNGAAISGSEGPGFAASDTSTCVAKTIITDLNEGDYVELQGRQSSGGPLSTDAAADVQWTMSVFYIGPTP